MREQKYEELRDLFRDLREAMGEFPEVLLNKGENEKNHTDLEIKESSMLGVESETKRVSTVGAYCKMIKEEKLEQGSVVKIDYYLVVDDETIYNFSLNTEKLNNRIEEYLLFPFEENPKFYDTSNDLVFKYRHLLKFFESIGFIDNFKK